MKTNAPEIQQAIHELLTLCLNTPPEIGGLFFSIHPHVSQVQVDLHPWGWDARRGDGRESFAIYIDQEGALPALVKMREQVEARIVRLKNTERPSESELKRLKLESLEAETAALRAELEVAHD
jgi:hypothetical protein